MGEATGRLAVVTGAGSGIEAAVARRLQAEGARVVALDINGAGLARGEGRRRPTRVEAGLTLDGGA
ncbi:MAG TPA: SDR family NAD(P)-dependent oxidoreductase [Candidatus Limnocylindrales bacterium]|nr:SDR family NAD(P)-dependent oxidoreductase [Candidatus Limnocylindrales bacterium]